MIFIPAGLAWPRGLTFLPPVFLNPPIPATTGGIGQPIRQGSGCRSHRVRRSFTCETLRAASISDHQVTAIILTGDTSTRYRRAIRRDPYYEPYWEMWAEQERHHYAAQPQNLGDYVPTLRIDTTGLDAGQVVRRAYDFITYYVE